MSCCGLREEIGLIVSPDALGRPIAYCSGYADLGWARGVFRDDFFLYRVDNHCVDTAGTEALERRSDELTDTTDVIYPFGLAPLLDQLLTGGVPRQAVQLPWLH